MRGIIRVSSTFRQRRKQQYTTFGEADIREPRTTEHFVTTTMMKRMMDPSKSSSQRPPPFVKRPPAGQASSRMGCLRGKGGPTRASGSGLGASGWPRYTSPTTGPASGSACSTPPMMPPPPPVSSTAPARSSTSLVSAPPRIIPSTVTPVARLR
ncbi:hypothetical protein SAY86_006534 [Trapa natans]|uniref:Uncharacterized protein n=1 Tax=Trapa natans TaxID=22666 RepID=A0AAN7L4P8_TRANT|nr:hypothetical protein SAY86_006534 [Trapa natans]